MWIKCPLETLKKERDTQNDFFPMEDELVKVDEKLGNAKTILKGLQPVSIAYDPFETNRIYCGTYGRGLWRSLDAGNNWEPI